MLYISILTCILHRSFPITCISCRSPNRRTASAYRLATTRSHRDGAPLPKSLRNEIGEACCLYGNGALAPPVTEDQRPQYRANGCSSAPNDTAALRRKFADAIGYMQAWFVVARSGARFTPKMLSPCWRISGFRVRWRADSCTRRSAAI